ncbi:MAG: 30S ribosomal protein S6 [Candidatus Aminicenantales bacterium]
MRLYETGFVISPKISDEERDNFIQQMADVVAKKGGKMLNENRWGRRKLAYPIRKFEEGFYVFFLYESEPDVPSELERLFKQTDGVLRYLTVKKDEKEHGKEKKPGIQEEVEKGSAEEASSKAEVKEEVVEPLPSETVEEEFAGEEKSSEDEEKKEE